MKNIRMKMIGAAIFCLLFMIGCGGGGGGGSQTVIAEPGLELTEISQYPAVFEGVVVKNSAEREFKITSTGSRSLHINPFSSSDPQFKVVSTDCLTKSPLANGVTCTFIASFTPAAHGRQNGNIYINGDVPKTIALTGFGYGLNVWISKITANCSSPIISVDVTVTDAVNLVRLIDLTEANFTLKQDGVTKGITVSENVDPDPVSVVLALDLSESLWARESDIRSSAKSFIDKLHEENPNTPAVGDGDEAAIYKFKANIASYPTLGFKTTDVAGKNDLKVAIDNTPTFPDPSLQGTALYDTLVAATNRLSSSGAYGKKAVIVLSDGYDESSGEELTEMIRIARESGVAIFTVFYVDPDPTKPYAAHAKPLIMQQIARETGGQYFNSSDYTDMNDIFVQISRVLSNKYTITYTPTSCDSALEINLEIKADNLAGKYGLDSMQYTIP